MARSPGARIMGMPRVRFTIRRLMVAVAIVAIYFGWSRWMERRSDRFRSLWIEHLYKFVENQLAEAHAGGSMLLSFQNV